jgi:hypothetical protein
MTGLRIAVVMAAAGLWLDGGLRVPSLMPKKIATTLGTSNNT